MQAEGSYISSVGKNQDWSNAPEAFFSGNPVQDRNANTFNEKLLRRSPILETQDRLVISGSELVLVGISLLKLWMENWISEEAQSSTEGKFHSFKIMKELKLQI